MITFFTGCSKNEKVITSFADAQNAKIGVMTGTTGEKIAKARFPKAEVKSFDDIMDAVAALRFRSPRKTVNCGDCRSRLKTRIVPLRSKRAMTNCWRQ